MKTLSLISILALTTITLSSCTHEYHSKKFHDDHAKYMEEYFKKMDKNQDGSISKKEYNKYSKEKFLKMDANKDSKISIEEFRQFKKNKMGKHLTT